MAVCRGGQAKLKKNALLCARVQVQVHVCVKDSAWHFYFFQEICMIQCFFVFTPRFVQDHCF